MALTLLSTLAVAAPLRELGPRFEAQTGIELRIELGPTKLLMERIAGGASADATILTQDKTDGLAASGAVLPDSRVDLVRSFVGVAVSAGARRPDIGTAAAFKAALLEATSVAYSRAGASGLFFVALLQRLGIEREINAKATVIPEGFTGELVANGRCELAVQQVSELMAVPGIDVVGRLPAEIEPGTPFSGGVFAASPRREEAARLLRFLGSEEAATVIRRFGLEPLAGSRTRPSPISGWDFQSQK